MLKFRNRSINEYLSFFLGLIVCNNVIYIYQGNSSNVNISAIYSFILFLFLVIRRNNLPINVLNKYLEPGMKSYSLIVFITLIPSTIIFTSTEFYSSPFKGVISFVLMITAAFDVILLRGNKENIFYGLFVGFVMNLLLSFFQYFCYLKGIYFSLSTWFPQVAFQENIGWYRAQGIFLETSYYAAFISVTLPIILTKIKSTYANIIMGSSLFLLGLSITGNIVNCLIGLALYFILIGKETMKGKKYGSKILILLFIVFVSLIFNTQIFRVLNTIGFSDNFRKGLVDAIITNTENNVSNTIRLEYQQKAFALIPDYLFGVGYNMASPLLQLKFGIVAAFNVLITNQLELGFLGLISYLIIIYNTGLKLLLRGENAYQKSLGIAMIVMFIAQVGNGIRWFGFCIVIYGLAAIEYYDIYTKKRSLNSNQLNLSK